MCQIFPTAANLAAGFLSPAAWELLPGSGTPSPPAGRRRATVQDGCAAGFCPGTEGGGKEGGRGDACAAALEPLQGQQQVY